MIVGAPPVPEVECVHCKRRVSCIRVDDGTMLYRPLAWRFPSAAHPLAGECPQCAGVFDSLHYLTLLDVPGGKHALYLQTQREGGPFAVTYEPRGPVPVAEAHQAASFVLWKHVREKAPGVYADCVRLGLVP